ncbi:MAG TPA: type II toxin-antitoxin system VapC family toxin [Gemmatimonadales bacterium]|nr:type II toxin-antitoxin system VapC family toxin [Gemmatimonadales bacterium]
MILVDANLLMYAAGAPHPHKAPSVRLLGQVATGEIAAAVDAEVLQEILHRYRAIERWADGRTVYDLTRRLFPEVIPITAEVLDRARDILDVDASIMARDALHAAVVLHHGLDAVCSFDRDFDRIPGIVRREPAP